VRGQHLGERDLEFGYRPLRKLDDAVVSGTIAESQGREIAIRRNDNTLLPHRSAHDLDVALVEAALAGFDDVVVGGAQQFGNVSRHADADEEPQAPTSSTVSMLVFATSAYVKQARMSSGSRAG
jgi:hypothetical protein